MHPPMTRSVLAGITLATLTAACSNTDDPATQRSTMEGDYRDGAYQATGWYGGLPSNITVDVTLVDDVITDVSVTPHATDPTSLDYQQRFADAVPDVVVGRRIDEVEIDRLAGSSGTPDGFNDALAQIRAQADTN